MWHECNHELQQYTADHSRTYIHMIKNHGKIHFMHMLLTDLGGRGRQGAIDGPDVAIFTDHASDTNFVELTDCALLALWPRVGA